MKHIRTFESFVNEAVGSTFEEAVKSLSKDEKAQLYDLSKNVVDKAKKAGFSLYVNFRSYRKGGTIEFCVKHNHNNVEGSKEYHFMNDFKYKVERSVRITPELDFDVTTGSYDGSWDEDTISVDKYFQIIK